MLKLLDKISYDYWAKYYFIRYGYSLEADTTSDFFREIGGESLEEENEILTVFDNSVDYFVANCNLEYFLNSLEGIIEKQEYEHYSSPTAKIYCKYSLGIKELKNLAETTGFYNDYNRRIIENYAKKLKEEAEQYDVLNIIEDIDAFLHK